MQVNQKIKKVFERETENILFLKEKLEDALYSSPSFTIEQEEGEVFRYKKTRITFRPQHSVTSSTWITPEIDTVNFLELTSPEKRLFSSLIERGYTSYYISKFAYYEECDHPLRDDNLKNILLKRARVTRKINGKEQPSYQYQLNGGNLYFHRILEKDPNFWLELVRASQETDLLQFSEIHLAADCNDDLMRNVTQAIKFGHYESSNLSPRAYYILDGIKVEGPVGKYSTKYKDLKKKEFSIQTLYFGDKRRQPISIAFYDKQSEAIERRNAYAYSKTRIELRLNPLKGATIPSLLILSLIRSYYHPKGSGFRLCVFLHYITNTIRFTNHYHEYGETDYSHWWMYNVLTPLFHAAASLFNEPLNTYVEGKAILPAPRNLISSGEMKRKRGRPIGSKDKKPRKPRMRKIRQN